MQVNLPNASQTEVTIRVILRSGILGFRFVLRKAGGVAGNRTPSTGQQHGNRAEKVCRHEKSFVSMGTLSDYHLKPELNSRTNEDRMNRLLVNDQF